MKTCLYKLLKLLSTVSVLAAMTLAFLLAGIRLFGFEIYTVLSGSMEPAYRTGALIYVKEVNPEELQVGDVITFRMSGGVTATHRIVELVEDEKNFGKVCFRTKGDANNVSDGSLVEQTAVIGSPVFTIPYLGFLASYIQTASGKFMMLSVCSGILFFTFIPELLFGMNEKKAKTSA